MKKDNPSPINNKGDNSRDINNLLCDLTYSSSFIYSKCSEAS